MVLKILKLVSLRITGNPKHKNTILKKIHQYYRTATCQYFLST